jgi:hypothetical protein
LIIFSAEWIHDKPTWTIKEAIKNLAGKFIPRRQRVAPSIGPSYHIF